ncbi:Glucose-methanol-choline oxidoreductase [Macleaya cordata]|uniref:Cholesterol oxidase n=1 Tax=Macleaya cordata TaxID=56857 RepID=A0A200QI20_MACCD|nr:Glucose-methanol-choline oxidoreductase [Macleaya cordata]
MERANGEVEMFADGDEVSYDAVVIGSGYGGSIAACRLSMAGVKVCLIEKGRKWEAQDFPTDSFKIMSALRMENRNLGFNFGPKDALFQVHEQDDSVAAVACGLGGGSLVNAGVMIPTPVCVRRNPKWPKEWEKNWDACEASASSMLRSQSITVEFSNAKIMREIVEEEIEECYPSSIKLSMNFDPEEAPSSIKMGSCLACGNCLSGCPYNAKNSTDKNYLASAIQANFSNSYCCNGNAVAYLSGSPAPLNAYGLDKKQFSKIPFQDRPGPSISSSYTSSLGFTIQSAVLPTAFPLLLFKGILTYGWPIGCCWFLHGIIDKLKYMMGLKASQGMVLNGMGYDESDGRITIEKDTDKICFSPPRDPLLQRKIQALQKLAKRLGGILFISRNRSTSVHLLGGCNASSDPSEGVCNSNGQVFKPKSSSAVHPGLYVCDASLIPCSIGINPCLTIATAAEHISRNLVQDVLKYKNSTHPAQFPTRKLQSSMDKKYIEFIGQYPKPEFEIGKKLETGKRSTVIIRETITGYLGGMPCTAYLTMKMNSRDQKGSNESNWVLGKPHPLLRGRVGGYVVFRALERDKLYIIDGEVDMCRVDNRTPYTQYMYYHLILASASGSRYVLEGKKIMNPYLLAPYMWRESTTLHVTLRTAHRSSLMEEMVDLKGELHLSVVNLLRSLISLKGNTRGQFIFLLLQSFLRTYILQTPRGSPIYLSSSDLDEKPYPPSDLHEIKTEDGCIISCRQWKCNQNQWKHEGQRQQNPILLINGYATESFWLPTEPKDLVRTLLEEGHETWLLQARLHPLHPSNDFTIEDIGKFDIPAVISKIVELHGPSVKVHVVAHCVGGLAIHIALMGGHISSTQIASLCCTNSSMFFKLTMSSLIKMRLPLIPISMGILGKNKILPMFESSKASPRHRLLKSIARLIPRHERCTLDECEVFSGIFGNAFWHDNVSQTMHHWLNKQSLSKLPLSAFPHLRKICLTGFIVNSNGKNTYLIHPERITLPTTYISGGRSLLVTPQTSFFANQYMKLHQPGYKHTRVVLENLGHSDIWIGEDSWKKVFPHILSHIKSSEEERIDVVDSIQESKYKKEALSWSDDPYEEGNQRFGSWVSPSVCFWLFMLFLWMLSAVLPTAFPLLLFKGISTYGWPIGFWFLHGIIDKLKYMMGLKASQGMVLNGMGYDESDGRITIEKDTDKICFSPPRDPLLQRKIQALQKLAKRLGGILFISRNRSTSVHLLGGCNASSDPSEGVCNSNGQVFKPKSSSAVHPGLYVCDASLIPCSIGINPCLTIATAAEHISRNLVQDVLKYKNSTHPAQFPTRKLQSSMDKKYIEFIGQYPKPEFEIGKKLETGKRSTVIIRETITGYLGGMPCTAYLTMKMNSRDQKGSNESNWVLGKPHPLLRGRVGGYVVFRALERDKLYIIDGEVDMCRVDNRTPYTQYMYYHLILASASGSRYVLEGKKIMNPYLLAPYMWRESTTLHVTLRTAHRSSLMEEMVDLKGELHLSVVNLLRSLISLKGNKRGRFICLLLQSFLRTYILQTPRGSPMYLSSSDLDLKPYPPSDLHEIKTDAGCIISCRQWKCNQNQWKHERQRQQNPVLLLNGYSTESFCLPTEPKDLVRTLLEEGNETWLLQARLHPLHPSNDFTIEDIGKFDIPAGKIRITFNLLSITNKY